MDSRGDDKGTTKGRREGVNELDFFPPYFFIYIFLAAENYTVGEDRGRLYDTLPPPFFFLHSHGLLIIGIIFLFVLFVLFPILCLASLYLSFSLLSK